MPRRREYEMAIPIVCPHCAHSKMEVDAKTYTCLNCKKSFSEDEVKASTLTEDRVLAVYKDKYEETVKKDARNIILEMLKC